MVRTISKIAIASLCLLALAVFTPQARASGADFGCSGSVNCVGTVNPSGSGFVGSGITVNAGAYNLPGLGDGDEMNELFTLAFDTNSGSITLTDQGSDDTTSANVTGVITSFMMTPVGSTGEQFTLNVMWTTPSGFVSKGTVDVLTSGSTCSANNKNCVDSVDINMVPSPEPASLLLMGTGLLGLGGAVRRRWLK